MHSEEEARIVEVLRNEYKVGRKCKGNCGSFDIGDIGCPQLGFH